MASEPIISVPDEMLLNNVIGDGERTPCFEEKQNTQIVLNFVPDTTTISTIAIQSGSTRAVIAVLQSGHFINLRILEMNPKLAAIARNVTDSEEMLNQHEDALEKLKTKRTPVEEMLRQGDKIGPTKNPDLYKAMAASLDTAWQDITATLDFRRQILQKAVRFHTNRAACLEYFAQVCPNKKQVLVTYRYAVEDGRRLIDKLKQITKEEPEEASYAIGLVEVWLDELQSNRVKWQDNLRTMANKQRQNLMAGEYERMIQEIESQFQAGYNREEIRNSLLHLSSSLDRSDTTDSKKSQLQRIIFNLIERVSIVMELEEEIKIFIETFTTLDAPHFKHAYEEKLKIIETFELQSIDEAKGRLEKRLEARKNYEAILEAPLDYTDDRIQELLNLDSGLDITSALERIRVARENSKRSVSQYLDEEMKDVEARYMKLAISPDKESEILILKNKIENIEDAVDKTQDTTGSTLLAKCQHFRGLLTRAEEVAKFLQANNVLDADGFKERYAAMLSADLCCQSEVPNPLRDCVATRLEIQRKYDAMLENPAAFSEGHIQTICNWDPTMDTKAAYDKFMFLREKARLNAGESRENGNHQTLKPFEPDEMGEPQEDNSQIEIERQIVSEKFEWQQEIVELPKRPEEKQELAEYENERQLKESEQLAEVQRKQRIEEAEIQKEVEQNRILEEMERQKENERQFQLFEIERQNMEAERKRQLEDIEQQRAEAEAERQRNLEELERQKGEAELKRRLEELERQAEFEMMRQSEQMKRQIAETEHKRQLEEFEKRSEAERKRQLEEFARRAEEIQQRQLEQLKRQRAAAEQQSQLEKLKRQHAAAEQQCQLEEINLQRQLEAELQHQLVVEAENERLEALRQANLERERQNKELEDQLQRELELRQQELAELEVQRQLALEIQQKKAELLEQEKLDQLRNAENERKRRVLEEQQQKALEYERECEARLREQRLSAEAIERERFEAEEERRALELQAFEAQKLREQHLDQLFKTLDFSLPDNLETARSDLNDFQRFEAIVEEMDNPPLELIEKMYEKKNKIIQCLQFYELIQKEDRILYIREITQLEHELFQVTTISEEIKNMSQQEGKDVNEPEIPTKEIPLQGNSFEEPKINYGYAGPAGDYLPSVSDIEVRTIFEQSTMQTQTAERDAKIVANCETQTLKLESPEPVLLVMQEPAKILSTIETQTPILAENDEVSPTWLESQPVQSDNSKIPSGNVFAPEEFKPEIPAKLVTSETQTPECAAPELVSRNFFTQNQSTIKFESIGAEQEQKRLLDNITQTPEPAAQLLRNTSAQTNTTEVNFPSDEANHEHGLGRRPSVLELITALNTQIKLEKAQETLNTSARRSSIEGKDISTKVKGFETNRLVDYPVQKPSISAHAPSLLTSSKRFFEKYEELFTSRIENEVSHTPQDTEISDSGAGVPCQAATLPRTKVKDYRKLFETSAEFQDSPRIVPIQVEFPSKGKVGHFRQLFQNEHPPPPLLPYQISSVRQTTKYDSVNRNYESNYSEHVNCRGVDSPMSPVGSPYVTFQDSRPESASSNYLGLRRPTKFIPAKFSESDYESDYESFKIEPIWIPPSQSSRPTSAYEFRPTSRCSKASDDFRPKSTESEKPEPPPKPSKLITKPVATKKPIPPPKPTKKNSPDKITTDQMLFNVAEPLSENLQKHKQLTTTLTKTEECKFYLRPIESPVEYDEELQVRRSISPTKYVSVTSTPIHFSRDNTPHVDDPSQIGKFYNKETFREERSWRSFDRERPESLEFAHTLSQLKSTSDNAGGKPKSNEFQQSTWQEVGGYPKSVDVFHSFENDPAEADKNENLAKTVHQIKIVKENL